VAAAIEMQRSLSTAEWPDGTQLRVRIGLHTAEPSLHRSGYVGIGVHRAARICAAAHGGQILLSNATAGIVEDLEPAEFDLHELGEFRLKDIARPQRLFQLVVLGLEREFDPPKTLDAARDPYGKVGTLLATDIVHWSGFIHAEGDDAAAEVSAEYRRIVREAVAAHEGITLEAIADSVLAVFGRPRDAVDCAVATRQRLREYEWPLGFECPTAFAVHTGRLVSQDHGGASVLYVAQLVNEPEPGQILVSHSTEALLEGERLDPWQLRDLGERRVKGFDASHRVFELVGQVDALTEGATIRP
jgi:class 3 adenylate cyclase